MFYMAIESIEDTPPKTNLPAVMPDTSMLSPLAAQRVLDRDTDPMPLPAEMRHVVYNLLATRGATAKTYPRISEILLEEYNMIYSAAEIERLYLNHINKIVAIRKQQRGVAFVDKPTVQNKADQLLNRHLDRAVKDFDKLDALDHALNAGAITVQEHAKSMKKLRLLNVNDLVKIANYVSPDKPQAGYLYPPDDEPDETPRLKESEKPQMTAFAKELSRAIDRGDAVEIQRIMLNENPSAQSTSMPSNSEPTKSKTPPNSKPKPRGRPKNKNKKRTNKTRTSVTKK